MTYEGVNFRNFWSICPGMPVAGQSSYVARARLPTSERETEGILRVPLYWRE